MKPCINILFLGGSKRVSIAEFFISAGAELNNGVKIFSYELNDEEPISSIGKIIIGLKWSDPNIVEDIKRVIEEYKINIIVPFVDIATILCGKLQKQLPSVHFAISTDIINNIMFNKRRAHDWFVGNKVLVPSILLKLPIIAKINTGSGAKGLKFLYTQAQFDLFLKEEPVNEYFLQEAIQGDEFSVDCYVDKMDNIISIVPRQRIEVVNGEATRSKTVKDTFIINQSHTILQIGGFNGPVTIQFIRDKITQLVYLIEINPRLGSGVLTSISAGANICKYILNDYLGISNHPVKDWKENLLMIRTFKEYYFYATDN